MSLSLGFVAWWCFMLPQSHEAPFSKSIPKLSGFEQLRFEHHPLGSMTWVNDSRIHRPKMFPEFCDKVTSSQIQRTIYRAWSGGVVKSFAHNNPPNNTARMKGLPKLCSENLMDCDSHCAFNMLEPNLKNGCEMYGSCTHASVHFCYGNTLA